MPVRHTVVPGTSVARLAKQYGLAPATIWDSPDNAELKALREDMNILAPGDVVVIPDKRTGGVARPTGARHVFRRVGVPMPFRIQLLTLGTPRKNQSYVLEVGGVRYDGVTDDEGRIERYLPNESETGRLIVNGGEIDVEVRLGHMTPVAQLSGIQRRLNNLGFNCGAPDGVMNDATNAALRAFQAAIGSEPTGEVDDATRDALETYAQEPGKFTALFASQGS